MHARERRRCARLRQPEHAAFTRGRHRRLQAPPLAPAGFGRTLYRDAGHSCPAQSQTKERV